MHNESQEQFTAWRQRSIVGRKFTKATERASETDRKWFAAHPGVEMYERRVIRHEFPPAPGLPPIVGVRVYQVQPGARLRQPIFWGGR